MPNYMSRREGALIASGYGPIAPGYDMDCFSSTVDTVPES
jgi:hypothetical protein